MLWFRGAIFTILVPAVVAGYVPWLLANSTLSPRRFAAGYWRIGWVLVVIGAAIYLRCLLSFLAAHGTPAIFFSRGLRAIWGEEPPSLVRSSLYRYSRNPMYLGVLTLILGEALVYKSLPVALYALGLFAFFHLLVVFVEEPHLRAREGQSYEDYRRRTPRWLGKKGSF
jgi:protein-S-isoprenylcysteine O-methyltransferase Ste14